MGVRVRVPYRRPELVDIRLNGNVLEKREWNGYETWVGNGYTQVQINLEPEWIRRADGLFVVSIGYVPDEKRRIGWTPPSEVLQR